MLRYIGTKVIKAVPMTRGEYNSIRGWNVPEGENPDDEGYLVEYLDGGKPNHTDYSGYISWSPKDVFERAYRAVSKLTAGMAIQALKAGQKVCRAGWNGKNMYLFLVQGSEVTQAVADHHGIGGEFFPVLDAIYMKTADGKVVPWLASQTDLLAEDYCIIE